MARRTLFLLTLAAWLAGSFGAAAQMAGAPMGQAKTQPGQPGSSADRVVHVTLGQAAVPLYGPWKFTVGDSPIDPTTGKPLWAEPDFDDSKWETVDLTPKAGAIDPYVGFSGYVPGWTARGHLGYWGSAWYRIQVHLETYPGEQLALAGPPDVNDGYQAFDNGELVGHFGDFTGSKPIVYHTQPAMFPLAGPEDKDTGSGPSISNKVLAFRVWMGPTTPTQSPYAGGFHTAPVLGEAAAVTAGYQMRWLELVRSEVSEAMEPLLFGLLASVAFSLILFDRSDRVYLWMGTLFLLLAAITGLFTVTALTQHLSIQTSDLLTRGLLQPLIFGGWVMVWWVWFGGHRPTWMPRVVTCLIVVAMVSTVFREQLYIEVVPHPVAATFDTINLVVRLFFIALLGWIVIQGILQQGLEGWLVLPVVVLRAFGMVQAQLLLRHIPAYFFPFGVAFNIGQISSELLGVVIALLLLRRLLRSVRRQRQMALDVKQAQEVQQVILPQSRIVMPGFEIESEYRPALEVGGDFFQVIPHKTDGSLLIVAGDVTGKGLKAGMLVALLIGAIRSTSDWSTDPMVILKALNQRLMGRNDAQATCLALRITSEGAVTLANAGHMVPYLNSEAMAMEGALPLGMIEGAEFSSMHFQLKLDDKLVLMSDGIAEATDAEGHLFGFERVHEILLTATTAAAVANAAQSFGQGDDISVISVTRTLLREPAVA